MNKLDFSDVREAFRRDTVVPDFQTVIEVRRRRQSWSAIGVAALVVAVIGGGVAVGRTPVAQQPVSPTYGMLACHGVAVSAQDYYYVLTPAKRCTELGPTLLAHTANAGRTWTVWAAPDTVTAGTYRTVMALDAGTVVVPGLITHNGGVSWEEVPTDIPDTTVAPKRWPVFSGIGEAHQEGGQAIGRGGQLTVDPVTGRQQWLTHQPPGWRSSFVANEITAPATDGSLWTAGDDASKLSVSVSRDRGRSWSSQVVVPGRGLIDVATRDGRTAYALVDTRLYRSADGGRSWSIVGTARMSTIQVAADGAVLGAQLEPPRLVASRDGGRTFAPVPGTDGAVGVIRTVTGAYAAVGEFRGGVETLVAISDDGVHFTRTVRPTGTRLP